MRAESSRLTEAMPCSTVQPTAMALAAEALADRSATAEAAELVRSQSRPAQASRALARRAPAVRGAASRSKTKVLTEAMPCSTVATATALM